MDVVAEPASAERQQGVLKGVLGDPAGILNRLLPGMQPNLPRPSTEVLEALQAAVYTTDAAGRITFYNQAAVDLWGIAPEIGKSEFCGSWRMEWPDGQPLPHDECPMAIALKEGRAIHGAEAVAIRPDGTRVPFLAYPTPLRDPTGKLVGAVNMLVNISTRKHVEKAAQTLAAIVASSDDAIVSKDLNGVIASWNHSAERLFGYSAEEAIGRPIMMLIPPDRDNEEPEIINRIRRGERIEHYETVRVRKDGSLVDISLTVSPVKDATGRVVGASKIARDISERKRAEEQQRLLLREMNHRVKNLFSLAGSIVSISARHAESPDDMASAVRARMAALASAHELTMPSMNTRGEVAETTTSLEVLLRTMLDPYLDAESKQRIELAGPEIAVSGRALTGLALLLHEFTTNAAKYGALSSTKGGLAIGWSVKNAELNLTWRETGGPRVVEDPEARGFGSVLTDATVAQFGGRVSREWRPEGLVIDLSVPLERLST